VYGSAATSYGTLLTILNNGNVGMGGVNNSAYKLHVSGTTYFQGNSIISAYSFVFKKTKNICILLKYFLKNP
jgi:hypothetical protein